MQHHQFQCSGLDEYAEMQEQIYGILYRSFFYNDHTFLEAIEAAVANAAEYSIGEHSSPILITLRIMTHDIAVTVTAATKEFDVCAFRQTLKRLSDDPAIRDGLERVCQAEKFRCRDMAYAHRLRISLYGCAWTIGHDGCKEINAAR